MGESYTVAQNTGHVEQATADMSLAQIDDIERRAKAQVVEADVETMKAISAEEKAAASDGPGGNTEARVYGDIALELAAPGVRMLSNLAEFMNERNDDVRGLTTTQSSRMPASAKSIDDDIQTTSRKPGVYRNDVTHSAYGGAGPAAALGRTKGPAAADAAPMKDILGKTVGTAKPGEDLVMRANIAQSSLKDQGKDAISSWGVKDAKIGPSIAEAKQLTFGLRNSNEQALESSLVARQQYDSQLSHIQQMAPPGMEMSLARGPSIRVADLLREAKDAGDNSSGGFGSGS